MTISKPRMFAQTHIVMNATKILYMFIIGLRMLVQIYIFISTSRKMEPM